MNFSDLPQEPTDTEMAPLMDSRAAYWVDVQYGDKTWHPLYIYDTLPGAQKMRDELNNAKRLSNYFVSMIPPTAARVRTVEVKVTVNP